jgi:hypothetical protein
MMTFQVRRPRSATKVRPRNFKTTAAEKSSSVTNPPTVEDDVKQIIDIRWTTQNAVFQHLRSTLFVRFLFTYATAFYCEIFLVKFKPVMVLYAFCFLSKLLLLWKMSILVYLWMHLAEPLKLV